MARKSQQAELQVGVPDRSSATSEAGVALIRTRNHLRILPALVPALVPVLAIVVLLGIWQALSQGKVFNPIVLPAPSAIARALVDLVQQGYFWDNARVTAWETVAGLAIGAGSGMILGTAIGLVRFFRRAFYPIVVGFQTLPRIALAPLFIVWFGFGLTPRIMFAATICFFPVTIAVILGLETVDADAQALLQSFGASRWQSYRKLAFPSSLPVVFAGLKTAVTLSLIGAIVGEFVGGDQGLGVLIDTFNYQLSISYSFAVIFALAVFGVLTYGVIEVIDRKVVFWRRHG